jgi:hypothetical protein
LRQKLQDSATRLIGYIPDTGGGHQGVRNAAGTRRGYYAAATNTTRDDLGRAVGTGNLLSSLIDD